MIRAVLIFVLVLPAMVVAESISLPLEQWKQMDRGQKVIELAPLKKLMKAVELAPDSSINIRYPGGDQGVTWAGQLRDWLVSLGVASSRMILEPGSGKADMMVLEIQPGAPTQ
ncbi:MAG TPA: hypothetical protein ENI80_03180 [Acidiferrobacteraceae bacterium]|nr:hypothetical protein [Acidiferrobacteraceae bacterium]